MINEKDIIEIKGKYYDKSPGPSKKINSIYPNTRLQPKRTIKAMDIKPIKRAKKPVDSPKTVDSGLKTVPKTTIEDSKKLEANKARTKKIKTKEADNLNDSTIDFSRIVEKNQKIKNRAICKRPSTIMSILIILLIAGWFLAYLYIPSISIGVANFSLNIKAGYPEYRPAGFRLSKPAETNQQKELVLRFNNGKDSYILKQTKSSWDSSALRAEIEKNHDGQIATTSEKGLTIFIFDKQAKWVNGGILYTIIDGADLSTDEIRNIATSI